MTTETLSTNPSPSMTLKRALVRLNWEVASYAIIIILSTIAHLWGLGNMAMHHDESIHAWSSWNYYTGRGGFSCYDPNPNDNIPSTSSTYCYDPVYHGPSLYMGTLVSFFLFGDGDAQARLPMAVAGILMVVSSWMLRPLIGRRGALIAAVLLGFSPSLLYYTRFARHDGLMVLWELWMVIGVFRYLQSGQLRYLYLMTIGLALAVGTHELYYILFFIFGIFLLVRLLSESPIGEAKLRISQNSFSYLGVGILAMLAVCVFLIIINPPLPVGQGLYLGEKAMLLGTTLLLAWLCQQVWPREKIVLSRLHDLWHNQRTGIAVAAAIFLTLYLVMYTNFFSYPRGAIDGAYAGLAYWLGSQQEYARGDQPWYYYLMQLPLYEPLGILSCIGAAVYVFTRNIFGERKPIAHTEEANRADAAERSTTEASAPSETPARAETTPPPVPANDNDPTNHDEPSAPLGESHGVPLQAHGPAAELFPLLLIFWYINAIVIFSWAGEKMPWLVVHMALPGNLLAAWVLGRLAANLIIPSEPSTRKEMLTPLLAIPPVVFLVLVSISVAFWRMYSSGEGQEGQGHLLQGLVALIVGGALIYTLLTLAQKTGPRMALSLVGLTLSLIIGAYMIRSTWMVVYHHPDTPIEPLIYTQTSPDIPRYVDDMYELSMNMTRNERDEDDVTGGYSLPIIVDNGASGGAGSLAWPLQWYFRHMKSVVWKSAEDLQKANDNAFRVTFPDGSEGLAPVVMIYQPHMTDSLRSFLQENYVQPYGEGGSLNWWFPEGNKCSPNDPGYKKFYFHNWKPQEQLREQLEKDCGRDFSDEVRSPLAPLLWPFQPKNWDTLSDFVLYRELPEPLKPGAREMEVWVRADLMSGTGGESAGSSGSGTVLRLVAQQSFGSTSTLDQPSGVAVDREGNVYVADTQNHRIQIFDANGTLEETIGSFGTGEGEFKEPRGIAVDRQGNIFVADTWNARIVKLSPDGEWLTTWGSGDQDIGNGHIATITGGTQEGNAQNPSGFFGPRGIAVDAEGNVYIADTGNRRIVVTDNDGNYLYQWGYSGSDPGQFNEPTGIALDSSGNAYVSDTWNSRVQVFPMGADGQISPTPVVTWRVSAWLPDTYDDPSIGVSPDGEVYVSVPTRFYVLAANMRGDVLLRWGGAGDDMASLNSPSGIAVGPEGGVYVVDRTANHILRFEIPEVQPASDEE